MEDKSKVMGGRSVVAWLSEHANTAPGRLAVDDGKVRLTFRELDGRSNQLANYLRLMGAGPETCTALLLDRSAAFVIAALAVMKTGAAYLPLDVSTPIERTAAILCDADASALITASDMSLDGVNCAVVRPDAGSNQSRDFDHHDISPERLAYVIYTSGSTGQPKGVEITHANLDNLIQWHQRAFGVTSADRASQVAGAGFDAAVWEIWPTLAAGATLFIADERTRRSPQALRDWIVEQEITISFVPTVLAEQLLYMPWPATTALRTLLTGADLLHRRPPEGLPFAFINNYGPTECTVVATSCCVSPDSEVDGPPPIGTAIDNTFALILDESMRPVQEDQAGELYLAGAHVGRGYRNNPQLTAEKFVSYTTPGGARMRMYRTGDRARWLPNGEIAFLGRVDDLVKIRGYRVELGEIVAWLDRYPGIQASAAAVRETDAGPALVSYLVCDPQARIAATDLRDFLAARLPEYMVPDSFVRMNSLPMTPNGKLDKSALPPPGPDNLLSAAEQPAAAEAASADSQQLQSRIAAMVAALLGQPSVRPEDNFFMLGGHSMLGVQLVAKIRDTFGVKLTLRQLFSAPTVAALAEEIGRLTSAPVA
jgi:amino acid adenylation domain-containing protein